MAQKPSRTRAKSKSAAAPTKARSARTPAKSKAGKAAPKATPEAASGPWSLPAPPLLMQGFSFGLPYPAVIFHCVVPATTPDERAELTSRFDALFEGAPDAAAVPAFSDPAKGGKAADTAIWFAALTARLPLLANLPVYVAPRPVAVRPAGMSFAVPALSRGLQPTADLLKIVGRLFGESRAPTAAAKEKAHAAFVALKASALTTSNTPRFVKAAVENGIAWQEFPWSMIQYGVGSKSMLMDSTFTHEASNIGARLAKQKGLTAAFLQRAGLPAPANAIAGSEEQAVEIAHQLGFPVVLKPADKDGGLAVQADLRSDDDVRWAYEGVRKVTKNVLVEKFHEGKDYRVLVFRGKAIWAKERRPAGVIGDGKSTIRDLAEAINADPRRGNDVYAALKKIRLDDDAANLLARDGLTFDSVPEKDEFVRLRRRANVSSGGMPVPVMDEIHPDNARLAERAAAVLGLDLAGIDLLMPDISRSWREVPAAICEINSQPELGADGEHLYADVLKALVRGDGHVPAIAVLGGEKAETIAQRVADTLKAQGCVVGVHDRSGVRIGEDVLLEGDAAPLKGGRMLTMDRRVEALVFAALDARVIGQGLPVPSIDALLVAGDLPAARGVEEQANGRAMTELLRLIAPHCRVIVVFDAKDKLDPAVREPLGKISRVQYLTDAGQRAPFMTRLLKAMVTAVQRGRRPESAPSLPS